MGGVVLGSVASLLLAYAREKLDMDLYNDDLEQLMKLSAVDVVGGPATTGWDPYTGAGSINARRAINLLRYPYELHQPAVVQGGAVQPGQDEVNLVMAGGNQIDEVIVAIRTGDRYISKLKPLKIEIITAAGLQKLPPL